MKKVFFILLGITASYSISFSQNWGIKTNLAHWTAGGSPNAGMEYSFNEKYTVEINAGFNPFSFGEDKKAHHWILQPEVRYWTRESFNGHFFGLHALVGQFNIGGFDIPIGKELRKFKDYNYRGLAYGSGISYGYQWRVKPQWNIELNLGVGYAYLTFDKYPCVKCDTKIESDTKNYFGVTKVAASLIYLIK